MLKTTTGKILLLVLGIIVLAGGLKAYSMQSLEDFRVSTEVDADDAVPFPVDI